MLNHAELQKIAALMEVLREEYAMLIASQRAAGRPIAHLSNVHEDAGAMQLRVLNEAAVLRQLGRIT